MKLYTLQEVSIIASQCDAVEINDIVTTVLDHDKEYDEAQKRLILLKLNERCKVLQRQLKEDHEANESNLFSLKIWRVVLPLTNRLRSWKRKSGPGSGRM